MHCAYGACIEEVSELHPKYTLWLVNKCCYWKQSLSPLFIKAHHSIIPQINSVQFISLQPMSS